MGWTRKQIFEMKEAQLQEEVLKPLFEAKGFKDVHIHQGTTEFGKDLVMWKPGEFGERVNYAVVAKAKDVTGSASNNSGAGTVATQIQQSFGKTFNDHATGEEQRVNHVYVVNSHEIPKRAIEAMMPVLKAGRLDRSVTFVDGDKLWTELEQNMPEKLIVGTLQGIQELLDKASDDYRITATTTGQFSIEPKRPGIAPPIASGNIVLDGNPESEAMRKELEQHFSTGAPVTIPKQFIEDFQLPEFLIPYLGSVLDGDWRIVLQSPRLPFPLIAKAIMVSEDGQTATLDYIHFESVQRGEDEITFSNEEQPVPWKLTLIFNRKQKRTSFGYNIKFKGLNVKEVRDGARFLEAVAKSGALHIEHANTGINLVTIKVKSGETDPPDPNSLILLDKLVTIQRKTKTILPFVDGPYPVAQVIPIYQTAQIVEEGITNLKVEPTTLAINDLDLARNILEIFKNGKPESLGLEVFDEYKVTIFEKEISLGKVAAFWDNFYMDNNGLDSLKAQIESFTPENPISITLIPSEGAKAQLHYLNWLPYELTTEPSAAEEVNK